MRGPRRRRRGRGHGAAGRRARWAAGPAAGPGGHRRRLSGPSRPPLPLPPFRVGRPPWPPCLLPRCRPGGRGGAGGSRGAALRGGPRPLPCVGPSSVPGPRAAAPRDRCHPGEAPAGPRAAPGPGVRHLQRSAAGGEQAARAASAWPPARPGSALALPTALRVCLRGYARVLGGIAPPRTRSALCRHVVLHAPRVAQACGGFLGASFARHATQGAKNLTGMRFGFCLQRVYSLVGWLSM